MRMITRTIPAALLLVVATACAGGGSGPDLGSVRPCDLLTPAQLADADLGPGRPADTGPLRSCSWMSEGAVFGVPTILALLPDADLAEVRASSPGAELTDADVAGRPGLRMTLGEVCTTTVDVGSGLLSLTADDCGRQPQMLELALANLPA